MPATAAMEVKFWRGRRPALAAATYLSSDPGEGVNTVRLRCADHSPSCGAQRVFRFLSLLGAFVLALDRDLEAFGVFLARL
jgi:hypothetical protein